ncbi:MAG: glycosyltransferase [Acidaminococcaceae bacterium]|jgi:cellulose synthase/poly-beta-1,6-N-acetylglucosamine synthase-like glycosyltransferase|nr:glycosyltransferase [Acidaminococcaceae bacterium]
MSTYFDYIMIPLQLLIVFFTIYYFTLSFFGLFGKKKEVKIYDEVKTFALIVCAHNEERVIGQLVENLKLLNYNHQLYDIYVVADNCQDQTAAVAAKAGALVQERFSDSGKGKGFALEWMFHRLFAMDKKYDAVCIFDADNLVHPNFLKEMNSRLCHGEKIIQGYLDTKNPEDSWVSAMFAISFWITNHIWHLAKYNIGLSCVLGGTGMCIDTEVLKRHGWGATCLTEDEEFTMKALMEGIPTTWAHDAVIYDEKPLTFKAAWNQRVRWAQGNFDVANRYIPKMLFKGIKEHNILLLDGVIDMFQPYFLLISAFFIIASYIYEFIPFYTNILYDVLPMAVWQVIGIGQYLFPVAVLIKIRASWKSWAYLLTYPFFIYTWIPITAIGFLKRNQHVWSHTLHTRAIGFNDVVIPEDVVHVGPKQVILTKALK